MSTSSEKDIFIGKNPGNFPLYLKSITPLASTRPRLVVYAHVASLERFKTKMQGERLKSQPLPHYNKNINHFNNFSSLIPKITIFVNLGLFPHFETVTIIRTWIKSHKYWRML